MFALSTKRRDMIDSYSVFNSDEIVKYPDLNNHLISLFDDGKMYKFGDSKRRDLTKEELESILNLSIVDVEDTD